MLSIGVLLIAMSSFLSRLVAISEAIFAPSPPPPIKNWGRGRRGKIYAQKGGENQKRTNRERERERGQHFQLHETIVRHVMRFRAHVGHPWSLVVEK